MISVHKRLYHIFGPGHPRYLFTKDFAIFSQMIVINKKFCTVINFLFKLFNIVFLFNFFSIFLSIRLFFLPAILLPQDPFHNFFIASFFGKPDHLHCSNPPSLLPPRIALWENKFLKLALLDARNAWCASIFGENSFWVKFFWDKFLWWKFFWWIFLGEKFWGKNFLGEIFLFVKIFGGGNYFWVTIFGVKIIFGWKFFKWNFFGFKFFGWKKWRKS